MPEEPLPWDQIESDPEFQAIPLPEKEKVFQGWNQEVTGYLKGQGAPEPEVADFQKAATERFRTKFVAPVVAEDSATLFNLARDPTDLRLLDAMQAQDAMERTKLPRPDGIPLTPMEDVPESGFLASVTAKGAQGGLHTLAGAVDIASNLVPETGQAQELIAQRDALLERRKELKKLPIGQLSKDPALRAEFKGIQPAVDKLNSQIRLQERGPRSQQFAGQLEQIAPLAFPMMGADPRSTNFMAQTGRATGAVAPPLAAMGIGGIGGGMVQMAAQSHSETYSQKEQELRAKGVTDEAEIARQASLAGGDAALIAIPTMGAFMGLGKLAAIGGAAAVGEAASPITKAVAGTGAALASNIAGSSAIRAIGAEPGKRLEAAIPTIESLTMDTLFAGYHGLGEFGKAFVTDPATQTVRTPIGTIDPVGRLVEPGTPEGVALRSVAGLDATKPTEVSAPSQDAQNLVDIISARHTNEQGVTDWPTVRDVLEKMQPSYSNNPEFLGVMDEALKMAEAQAPRTMEQEIAPDLAPERVAEAPKPPVPEAASAPESALPPDYQRAVDLPPAKAARELNIPVEEVQRRAAVAKEVLSDKYAEDPLASPEVRKFKSLERPEGGAAGGSGGSRPKPKPIGTPPSGSTEWLKIQPIYKRGGFSGIREGASPILQTRQKNPIGKQLGRATDRQFDVEADLTGRMVKDLDAKLKGLSSSEQQAAFDELSAFQREKENGRPTPPLSANAQRVLSGWQDVAEFTGLLAQAKNVKVADAGGYRPIRLIGRDYLPRMIQADVMRAIRNPERFPTEFNKLAQEIATQRGISNDEAAAFLNGMAGGKARTGTNDFMGNIEVGRQERLPESFYEYDLRKIIPHYINRYAKRMGQIIAYGQRLGPDNAPIQKNLWDYAKAEVRGGDTTTAQWLNEAEAQSRNERTLTGVGKLGQRLQTAATGLLLGNPTSTVPRNLLSGLETQAEMFGATRTLGSFKDVLKASERVGAKELGIVRDDLASMLHAEQLPDDSMVDRGIRSVTDTFLKVSGFDASERFVRTINFLSGSSFARDAAAAIKANPTSRFAKQAQALFKRLGVDANKIAAENGEWKTGDETQKFIRAAINQTQGGYKFNQVPLWASTPAGRFFYQFGRWGTQRAQNLWENVVKPAFVGTDIMVHGVPMTVRDFKPLARMGIGTVALGEAFGALGKVFFDRDRKDASFTEIQTALSEDKKKAMKLIGGRLINDIIMSGSLGVWGTPIDLATAAKDGSRMKNPAEPPAANMIRSMVGFGSDVWDQGGVTGDDVKKLALSTVPGPTAVVDSVRNLFDEPKFEAENDVRTLRAAAERFGQDKGMDVEYKGRESSRKTERTPVFTGLRDALLVGDSEKARKVMDEYLKSLPLKERRGAKAAMKSSVKARQPFRVGSFNSAEHKAEFMKWARKNLSAQDVEQITRTQGRYEHTAKALGLW